MKFVASRSILNNIVMTLVVNLALGFITASAFAQSESFTFEPGGKVTLRNLAQPRLHARCVVYSMKIPVAFENAGNILDNLADVGPNQFAEVFVGEPGELCDQEKSLFTARFPESTLKLSETKTVESVRYSSEAPCYLSSNPVPVGLGRLHPILFKLSAKRSNGGYLDLKGVVPDLQYPPEIPGRTLIPPPEVDVMLVLGATDGSDSNLGLACVTVPLKVLR